VFTHAPTGHHLVVGAICARTALRDTRAGRVKALRERAAKAHKTRRILAEQRGEFLAQHPGLAEALNTDHYIVADIARRFHQYGTLSDKQVALVFKIAAEAAQPTPATPTAPVPTGKAVRVTGTVVSTRFDETDYGTVKKMLVEHPDGWRVWGTVPKAIGLAERGDGVEFTAEVTPSRDDETFGFFKRPRLAQFTDTKGEAA
jgi:hypothetical protein